MSGKGDSIFDEEVIETEPETEPSPKNQRSNSKGLTIQLEDANEFIEELHFATQALSDVAKKAQVLKDLDLLSNKISKMKDIEIDTSVFEEKFDIELKKLTNKINNISNNVDFSELDEINIKLHEINKKAKPTSFLKTLFLILFTFSSGWLLNYSIDVKELFKEISNDNQKIIKLFIDNKMITIGQNKKYDYIVISKENKFIKSKNGDKVIVIKKDK